MQGTGTKTSPYIPENWEEFLTAVGKSGAYVSLPEDGGTFDMNDITPTGVGTIPFQCVEIQGNGWTIANAYNMTWEKIEGTGSVKIYNLNITNFFHENGDDVFHAYQDSYKIHKFNLYKCQISGIKISGKNNSAVFGNGIYLYSCGINIAFGDVEHILMDDEYDYGEFCNVKVDYSGCTVDFTETSDYRFNCYRFNNSFIRVFTNPEKTQVIEFSSKEELRSNNIVEVDGQYYVYNASGIKTAVTEEQIKDAAYLRSVGFPIAGV